MKRLKLRGRRGRVRFDSKALADVLEFDAGEQLVVSTGTLRLALAWRGGSLRSASVIRSVVSGRSSSSGPGPATRALEASSRPLVSALEVAEADALHVADQIVDLVVEERKAGREEHRRNDVRLEVLFVDEFVVISSA